MPTPVALLDANVLFPITLTDLLLRLAEIDLFRPVWSAAIHAEWSRNLLVARPDLTAEQVDRRRRTMDRAFPHAVVTGYEPLTVTLSLPDPDDRHVLAAAIHSRATEIVTFNRRDFPAERLALYGLVATHPDEFLSRLLRSHPTVAKPVLDHVLGHPTETPDRTNPALHRLSVMGLGETVGATLELYEIVGPGG